MNTPTNSEALPLTNCSDLLESHVDLGDKWPAFIASARTRCEAFFAVMGKEEA